MYEHLIEFYNSHVHSMRCYENFPETIEIRQLTSFLDNSGTRKKDIIQKLVIVKNANLNMLLQMLCTETCTN